jgi:hypothetical protein
MKEVNTRFWLTLVYTLRASQDHLNLEKYRSTSTRVYLFRVEGLGFRV